MSLPKALIRDISRQCAAELSRQVASHAASMPVAELRGYVRARARATVRRRSVDILQQNPRDAMRVDDLIDAALACTVHLVLSAYQSPPISAITSPHVGEALPILLPLRTADAQPQRSRAAA